MTNNEKTGTGTPSLPGSPGAQPVPPSDPQEIQADIAATRAELGDTVADLAAKADVKARAQQGVETAKDRTVEAASQVGETVRRPGPLAAIGVAALAALAAIGIRKRRAARADSQRWWHKLRRG